MRSADRHVRRVLGAVVVALVVAVAGCGGESSPAGDERTPEPASPAVSEQPPVEASGRVLRVPSSYPSIQAAVDASRPGDLVLIAPGTYHEAVEVTDENPGVVIRG